MPSLQLGSLTHGGLYEHEVDLDGGRCAGGDPDGGARACVALAYMADQVGNAVLGLEITFPNTTARPGVYQTHCNPQSLALPEFPGSDL